MKRTEYSLSLFFSMVIILVASIAQAEVTMCTPIHQSDIPYTINAPGLYCLATDLIATSTSENIITINSSYVVIDLNDHRIGGGATSGTTQAVGIYSNSNKNIVIRNGLVRALLYGIQCDDTLTPGRASGIEITEIKFNENTYAAVKVVGLGTHIRDNVVLSTGGSTAPPTVSAYGIWLQGEGSIIRDNVVTNTQTPAGGSSYGIYIDASSNYSTVDNNRITNLTSAATSVGVSVNSSDVLVQGNVVFNTGTGVFFKDGTGAYRNNTAIHYTTSFSGGFDGGANVSNQ